MWCVHWWYHAWVQKRISGTCAKEGCQRYVRALLHSQVVTDFKTLPSDLQDVRSIAIKDSKFCESQPLTYLSIPKTL